MVNSYGSYNREDAEADGVHWPFPLNTSIAQIYGLQDNVFTCPPHNAPYKKCDILEREKTGSVGMVYSLTSETEDHNITSLWCRDGLPEIIKSLYYEDVSQIIKALPKERHYNVVIPRALKSKFVFYRQTPSFQKAITLQKALKGDTIIATQIVGDFVQAWGKNKLWLPMKNMNLADDPQILQFKGWFNRNSPESLAI